MPFAADEDTTDFLDKLEAKRAQGLCMCQHCSLPAVHGGFCDACLRECVDEEDRGDSDA